MILLLLAVITLGTPPPTPREILPGEIRPGEIRPGVLRIARSSPSRLDADRRVAMEELQLRQIDHETCDTRRGEVLETPASPTN